MKVWESPFIPSHLTFKKVSNFTQFHTINQIYLFLQSICVGKQELGLVSDPSSKGHEIPPSSSIYTTLRASFRLWVLLRLGFAIATTSGTSFVFNDQTKTSQNPTFINKASLLYSQYPDCSLSFLLVLRFHEGNRPSWSG